MSSEKMPDSFEEARPRLRPLLRGRWHVEVPRLRAEIEGATYNGHLATMPFGHDAVVALGYDTPERTLQVTPDELSSWKISFPEALKAATHNLRMLTAPRFHALQAGVHVGDWSDGYDTSRILLPEVMRQCGIDGEIVMMMPSRRAGILIAPASSVEAQLWMLGCARQLIEEQGGLISAAMYRYKERRVSEHKPADRHVATKLSELQKITAGALYGEQKQALEALHSRQGKDIFVASYKVGQRPGGGWLSACSWTKGVTSLLPKTDIVNMVVVDPRGGDQHRVKMLDWETMRGLVGDLMQSTGTFPPRFMVSGFPPEDALARSPAAAI
ncbi:hypothetical protein ACFJGW_05795 [Burkholderiaceae bacterium UC74_6]